MKEPKVAIGELTKKAHLQEQLYRESLRYGASLLLQAEQQLDPQELPSLLDAISALERAQWHRSLHEAFRRALAELE